MEYSGELDESEHFIFSDEDAGSIQTLLGYMQDLLSRRAYILKEAEKRAEPITLEHKRMEKSLITILGRCMGIDPEHLSFAKWWDCTSSPTGKCVYNVFEDPMEDNCLFCHDPKERK